MPFHALFFLIGKRLNGDQGQKEWKIVRFENFQIISDPNVYEYSDIDVTKTRKINEENDFFTLFEFSAKWDPIPTMLCQNHTNIIKGFIGQTTAFNKN